MRPLIVAAVLLTLHSPLFAATAAPPAPPAATPTRTAAPPRVDVNRASAAELVVVPGIGERLAQAIVELREKKGPYTKLEDLLEVRGIGEKNLASLSAHLMVAQPSPQAVAPATARQ